MKRGKGILKGKKGIIFGALDSQSIAWKVAEKVVSEGAEVVLTNAPIALRFGNLDELGEKLKSPVIPADATSEHDLRNLISETLNHFGGKIDFVLHSIGMSINIRNKKHYADTRYDWMMKTFDISAISFHKVMQNLWKMDAMNEGGSIIALTYIASQRVFPDYGEMAESKALLESFARSFGYHFGKKNKVRVNTVSQSPTMTTAGSGIKGFQEFFDYSDKMSPLGNASAESCADFCAVMFSDYTKSITMQNLYHDGGFSKMGMSPDVLMPDSTREDK